MNTLKINKPSIARYAHWFLLISLIAISAAGFTLYQGLQNGDPRPFFGWLIGFSFWFSIAIGMLFLIMLWYIFGAGWPIVIRRQLEHCLSAIPGLFILLAPLICIPLISDKHKGIVWKWLDPETITAGGISVGSDILYLKKQAYLNLPFFCCRVVLYGLILSTIAFLLRKYSFSLDNNPQSSYIHKARKLSAIGIPITALTATFAAFDFFMSISYHWFSTMYGVCFFATSMRAGLAVTILLCAALAHQGYLKGLFNQAHRYELACLSLAFTIFWAYVTFSQYFLIYNANMPEETFWYSMRELHIDGTKNSWWWVGLLGLVFGYFVVPFIYLLSYYNKVNVKRLILIACWILVFHIVDLYFNILPFQIPANNALGYIVQPFSIELTDVTALIGIGSFCAWSFLNSLKKAAVIPINDPFIQESIHHHE
jgi:hypothetical protein